MRLHSLLTALSLASLAHVTMSCTGSAGSDGSGSPPDATAPRPADQASGPMDMTPAPDLIVAFDLAPTPDLAASIDFAPALDLEASIDLAPPIDLGLPTDCQGACPCPAGMVTVSAPGGGSYCLDAVEVSYAAYEVFFNANPPTAMQDDFCAWNHGWLPANDWPQPPLNGDDPVRWVNWCQAQAYCRYAGKHLCGHIGGGAIALPSANDAKQDQWFNACSAQGANVYPYGNAFVKALCNGEGTRSPQSWHAFPNCAGGQPGLLEMSGNVAEWEDACDVANGPTDNCGARGGSYKDNQALLRCDGNGSAPTHPRNYIGRDVGFRCCL